MLTKCFLCENSKLRLYVHATERDKTSFVYQNYFEKQVKGKTLRWAYYMYFAVIDMIYNIKLDVIPLST